MKILPFPELLPEIFSSLSEKLPDYSTSNLLIWRKKSPAKLYRFCRALKFMNTLFPDSWKINPTSFSKNAPRSPDLSF